MHIRDLPLNDDDTKGTLYFECHYIDAKTGKVVSVVSADQNVEKIEGKWLITNVAGGDAGRAQRLSRLE